MLMLAKLVQTNAASLVLVPNLQDLAMCSSQSEQTIADTTPRDAFSKYKHVIDDIQAFIHETAGKDSMWIARLLVLNKTQKKLAMYREELEEVSKMLQLSVNIGGS